MEKIKNSFIINSIQAREQCKKAVGFLDTNAGYEVVIYQGDKKKTREQCAYFHSLLGEFVKVANESGNGGILDNNIGWWKYQIKKQAEFYDTKKGWLFNEERAKQINTELNKLPADIKSDIVKAMTMNVKSIKEATTKELGVLIDNLLIQIVFNLPQRIIITSEFLTKAIEDRYNDLMNGEYQQNDLLINQLLTLIDDKLTFQEANGVYKLKI
jgi:hypothetical protein